MIHLVVLLADIYTTLYFTYFLYKKFRPIRIFSNQEKQNWYLTEMLKMIITFKWSSACIKPIMVRGLGNMWAINSRSSKVLNYHEN